MTIKKVVELQDLLFTIDRMKTSMQSTYSKKIITEVEIHSGTLMLEELTHLQQTQHQNISVIENFLLLFKELECPTDEETTQFRNMI